MEQLYESTVEQLEHMRLPRTTTANEVQGPGWLPSGAAPRESSSHELLAWLAQQQLSHATQALRELGATRIEHLRHLREEDLASVRVPTGPLRALETRRLLEALEQPPWAPALWESGHVHPYPHASKTR